METRKIKPEEQALITYLLQKANINPANYPISDTVHEYEGGKMGSIHLVNENTGEYDGDIIQAQYIDEDDVIVMITLTKDTNNNLLDLDFWKVNFEKLIRYPKPEDLVFDNFKPIKEE